MMQGLYGLICLYMDFKGFRDSIPVVEHQMQNKHKVETRGIDALRRVSIATPERKTPQPPPPPHGVGFPNTIP